MFRYKSIYIVFMAMMYPHVVCADMAVLDDALRATYTACVGINDELYDLKKMAGINTAVTAVGAVAGAGATAVGLVKAANDKELDRLIKELREMTKNVRQSTYDEAQAFRLAFNKEYVTASHEITKELQEKDKKWGDLYSQSKKLGNWRTGLIAGSAATNVAGAVIAGTNQVKGDLKSQIDSCKKSIADLRRIIGQARIEGIDVTEASEIVTVCGDFEYVDVSKINTRGRGAMVSSIVGATTGTAGTVTSAMANSDSVRGYANVESGQKEKNLNTAANVLSGATTVASATATAFNAAQINAIKKVAAVAEKCTEILK